LNIYQFKHLRSILEKESHRPPAWQDVLLEHIVNHALKLPQIHPGHAEKR
jgi:hypothetical protein